MEVRRTVPVKIDVTESDAVLLHDTIDQFRDAAKNVGFKLFRSLHTSSDGDAPVGVRINTGTVTESGFDPAPVLVRSGVHGESPLL